MVACVAKISFDYRGRHLEPGQKLILPFDDASNLLFLGYVNIVEGENVGNSSND